MKKTVIKLLAEANAQVTAYSPEEAMTLVGAPDVLFVDVRDNFEVLSEGYVPGALHASRGLLEFYIDPQSPYHKPELASGKKLVFYCKSGGRSALAAQRAQEMGLERVAHVAGGFGSWKAKGGPVEATPESAGFTGLA